MSLDGLHDHQLEANAKTIFSLSEKWDDADDDSVETGAMDDDAENQPAGADMMPALDEKMEISKKTAKKETESVKRKRPAMRAKPVSNETATSQQSSIAGDSGAISELASDIGVFRLDWRQPIMKSCIFLSPTDFQWMHGGQPGGRTAAQHLATAVDDCLHYYYFRHEPRNTSVPDPFGLHADADEWYI